MDPSTGGICIMVDETTIKPSKPIFVDEDVVVDERHISTFGLLYAPISRMVEPLLWLEHVEDTKGTLSSQTRHDLCGIVRGVIVDNDDLPGDTFNSDLFLQLLDYSRKVAAPVIGTNNDTEINFCSTLTHL